MNNNDPIANSLNMAPMTILDPIKNMEMMAHDDSAKKDFEFARSNLYNIIENGSSALEDLADVAKQSQNPKVYEVMAAMIKTIVDANKDLLLLQKNIRGLENSDQPKNETAKTINNNNVFVGSTAELQKLIEMSKNKENKNDDT